MRSHLLAVLVLVAEHVAHPGTVADRLVGMIYERPVLDRGDLLDVLDIIPERAEATFRWLRTRSLLSRGIRVVPRRGNRLDGSATLFSSLNWDALRAARTSDWDLAREFVGEAGHLEAEELSRWVRALRDWSSDHFEAEQVVVPTTNVWSPPRASDRWGRRALGAAVEEGAEILAFVRPAAEATDAVRQRLADRLPPAPTRLCRVWRIRESRAELRPLDAGVEEAYEFFSDEVLAAGLRLGDPVSVRHDAIAPGVAITTLDPAVELGRRAKTTLTARSLPEHLGALLDEADLVTRPSEPPPIRRVA